MKTTVSIIIPIYNAEKYIESAIQDILNQSFQDFEVICVDDGSSDLSASLLKRYSSKDHRIKILHQDNQGAGVARNNGLKQAKGDFIIFLDSDDRFEPDMLTKSVEAACANCADVVIFDFSEFDDATGIVTNSSCGINKQNAPMNQCFSSESICDKIFWITNPAPYNKLFRKSFLIDNNLQFDSTPYANDIFFVYMSLLLAHKIYCISDRLLRYRCNNSASTTGNNLREKHPNIVKNYLEALIAQMKERGIKLNGTVGFLEFYYEQLLFNMSFVVKDKRSLRVFFDNVKNSLYSTEFNYDFNNPVNLSKNNAKLLDVIFNGDIEDYLLFKLRNKTSYDRRKHWYIDEQIFEPGSRVVIYGAGDVGTDAYRQLSNSKKVQIVGWVDKYLRYNEQLDVSITDVASVDEIECDVILIAIMNKDKSKDAREELARKTIRKHRIVDVRFV